MTAFANPEIKIVIECPFCTHKMKIPVDRRLQVTCPNPVCRKVFKYRSNSEKKSLRKYIFPALILICSFFTLYAGFEYWNKPDVQKYPTEAYKPEPIGWSIATSDKYEPIKKLEERKGENCRFKNPDTNLIDKRFISGAQCREWKQFWCLVDEQVGDVGTTCKIEIGLMSEKEKDGIKNGSNKFLQYTFQDSRFSDKFSKCQGYDSAKKTCAVAGDFTNCMKIIWNKNYSTLKSFCE